MPRGGNEAAGAKRTSFNRAPAAAAGRGDPTPIPKFVLPEVAGRRFIQNCTKGKRLTELHFHKTGRCRPIPKFVHKMTPGNNACTGKKIRRRSSSQHNDDDNWKMAELSDGLPACMHELH